MIDHFLFQVFIYLVAAVVSVPIAKRLGMGSVLGYLIAGVIIGPFVLKLVGQDTEDVMHFAEFGVVLMLFLIGLELRPALLWRLKKPILGVGSSQLALTTAIIFLIAFFVGLPWKESLAIGLILALSSTAIVLQTLSEKGLLKTQAGRNSFSVLLFQGAGSLEDIHNLIDRFQIIGAAAGSLFVFKGKYRAVLINYPNADEKGNRRLTQAA